MLKEGDKAPDFRCPADDGKTVALADFKGRNLVLYFYPKADTTGCTSEAIQFRDAMDDFEKADAAIVGVSGDSVAAQAKFKEKYDLNFPLLADREFDVIEAYGARRMKSFFGKTALGIVRSSFWIGPDGTIRKIWPKVVVNGHAAEVLAALKAD
ncbi:MAG: thioredoxin-dependent thiol peroxidase [Candidatus Acidiferrales bacterium]